MEQRKLEIKTRTLKKSADGMGGILGNLLPSLGVGMGGVQGLARKPGGNSSESLSRGSQGSSQQGALDDIISAIRTGKAFGGDDAGAGGARGPRAGFRSRDELRQGQGAGGAASFEMLKSSASNLLEGVTVTGVGANGAASEPALNFPKSPSHAATKGQTKSIRAALRKMNGAVSPAGGSRMMSMESLLKVDVDIAAVSAPADLSGSRDGLVTPRTAIHAPSSGL